MTTSSPTDVNYQTNRIQSNALLVGNREVCTVGANTALPSDLTRHPFTRSTGNGIIYLVGEVTLTGVVAADEVVLTLPLDRPILSISFLLGSIADAPLHPPVALKFEGNEVKASAAINTGTVLYFDGIVYLAG